MERLRVSSRSRPRFLTNCSAPTPPRKCDAGTCHVSKFGRRRPKAGSANFNESSIRTRCLMASKEIAFTILWRPNCEEGSSYRP
jgi:hypothetical protein